MAANKFATMLYKNTNKITLILAYAVLEWTLIILLLLNSLFSYLIIKFADYFGLKPPCLWCSRIDHFFEPGKGKNLHRDLLCEAHASEISKLGYCSNHQKIASYQNMCEDCSSSRPDFRGVSKNLAFFPWVKEIGMIHNDEDKVVDNAEAGLNCSCCGVTLEKQIYSPYVLINPSNWDCFKYTQKENLITEEGKNDQLGIRDDNSDHAGSDFMMDHEFESKTEKQLISNVNGGAEEAEEDSSVSMHKFGLNELEGNEEDKEEMLLEGEREFIKEENSSMKMKDLISDECSKADASFEIHPQHLEFFIDCSGQQLVPVELVGSTTEEDEIQYRVEENQENRDHQEAHLGTESNIVAQVENFTDNRCCIGEEDAVFFVQENLKFAVFESMEMEETENSLVFHAKERDLVYEQVAITRADETPSVEINDIHDIAASAVSNVVSQVQKNKTESEVLIQTETAVLDVEDRESDVPTVNEEVSQTIISETEAEVSIGTEIPDLNLTDDGHVQDIVCSHEDPSTSYTNFHENHEHGSERKSQEEIVELKALSVELSDHKINNQLSIGSDVNGTEEEKMSDTPTSVDSVHHLHKKFLLLERKESGTEESLDGSVISEFEGGYGVMTVERLTSALRAERKALHVVYAELEEERSASAIAANQTMAMITRLQEEKAAMQMEALQYQRMMEEQSEYDQEALQLMNELVVKRDKEKQELEKGLEICKKKLMDYEAKEKMGMLRRSKDGSTRSGFSSASCSNGEDSDEISIDLNQEAKEEDGFYSHQENGNHNTPVDAVLNFGDSFGDFEEERMSIIEQLKVLEDKLFTLSEEEQHLEDSRPVEHFYQENGKHLDESSDFNGEESNGVANIYYSKEMNGKHRKEGIIMGAKAKRLLPFFDAVTGENENGVLNGHDNGFESVVTRFELEDRRAAIEEEVDQLYARMHALETDKEFLKHCISSMKKGDKGMNLLQEILQHLRDLRNVEIRVKNYSDGPLA